MLVSVTVTVLVSVTVTVLVSVAVTLAVLEIFCNTNLELLSYDTAFLLLLH